MTSLLTNCMTILSSLPVGLSHHRRSRLISEEARTDVFKKAFRKEYSSLLTSCESLTISHIYIASIRVSKAPKRPPSMTHSVNEQETGADWNLFDGKSMSVSPITPASQIPCRTPSSLSSRIKARRPVSRISPKSQEPAPVRQGIKSTAQAIQQRRPQRRRSRSVSAPQQSTRIRRRSNSLPRSTSCHVGEQKEETPNRVQFVENEVFVQSKVEDQTDEELPMRGRSSFRLGARTPRSPTPFCRQPIDISSDEDEDEEEDMEEGTNVSKASSQFADELEAGAGFDVGDKWQEELSTVAVAEQETKGNINRDDTKDVRHSVRFAQDEAVTEKCESVEVKEVRGMRVPRSKGHTRSRRDPTPFVRRVYEPSESEEDEIEDKSSKTDECGSAAVTDRDVDEESGDEFTGESEQVHCRKRETSPVRDEVVQTERVPLRERFGTNDAAEQGSEHRKRTVQFCDLPSRECVPGSNLKKVSSRRPTPFGPRDHSVHQEDDDDDTNSLS